MTPKKQHRNELLTNDRSASSNSKMGTQMLRSPSELVAHKFEDGRKNIVLNKRLRTSIAETRAEFRDNGLIRQPLAMTKERGLIKNSSADAKLTAAGESWDKKMRRKRSVGAVFSRPIDSDVELKRTMHHKLIGEPGGGNKLDPISSPAGSSAHATPKTEQEKSVLSRNLHPVQNKERGLGKGNIQLNNGEENLAVCPSPVVKGKASRAPRNGSTHGTNSASNVPRISGALESWEQPQGVKINPSIGSYNNRKRGIPAGSSPLPITHWVGQRPQKNTCMRRTNLVPISNHDEAQMQSKECSPSDLGARLNSGVTNVSLLSRSAATGTHNFKVKTEKFSSPARLYESEESGAGEHRLKERGVGSVYVPFSRPSISPRTEKLDKAVTTKPLQSARSGSDKNGSKSGRLLKKLSDRKGFSSLFHVANGASPDFNGESEDDHEELLEAANFACNSTVLACSSPYWKKVEALFASISPDERSYLSQQLKLEDEYSGSLKQIFGPGNNILRKMGDHGHEEISTFNLFSGERNGHKKNQIRRKDSSEEFVQQLQDSSLIGSLDTEGCTPLYQRVLSALIVEDEIEGCKENEFGRSRSSSDDVCFIIDSESKNRSLQNFSEPIVGIQTQKNGNSNQFFSCNENTDNNRVRNARVHPCNSELLHGEGGYEHSQVELARFSRCDHAPRSSQTKSNGISSSDCQYDEMCLEEKLVLELQSVGLYLESMPSLDDKEDEVLNQEIEQLERGLHQKIGKKKMCLDKLYKAIQEENDAEKRNPEQVAMDKLVELAYQKLLATRGRGIAKVSKQSALAFAKRTLSRCQKFENSGASCFAEPALRDIVYAAPPLVNKPELLPDANLEVANGSLPGCTNESSVDVSETSGRQSDHDFAKNGPISNRGKKKEVLLDDVGGAVFRSTSTLGISGDAKGKRSERDRDRETSIRNPASKNGHSSMGGSKGERKMKSKPKQKTAQLSTSGNGFVNKRDVRLISSDNGPPDSSKETKKSTDFPNLPLNDINSIELGVDSDNGVTHDFSSLFNFDEDGLQDHDSIGLEIPMDDLSSIMFDH